MCISLIQNEPCIAVINDEVKICKGCLQESITGILASKWKEAGKLKKLGIIEMWDSEYLWGGKKVYTWTVRHIDNHPDCYNYEIKKTQKIYSDTLNYTSM
ncbi:MAG: hypothetical protein S4CHLAM6_09520 [Chlamydiae bacterium]|nr:hypothetical protein [Chlamydiota bacterium]